MSEKLTEYIGCCVKIKCDKFTYSGEIVLLDKDTVVLTKSSRNEIATSIKYLGINHTLILGVDIIKFSVDKSVNHDLDSCEINSALNVYTSASQPPFIKRGGSSSAVHRHSIKLTNPSQDRIHKSQSSIFPDTNNQSSSSHSISKDDNSFSAINEFHKSPSFNLHTENQRNRKVSSSSIAKDPSWMSYEFDENTAEFDFDKNLALFNKSAFGTNSKQPIAESSTSSDSGGNNLVLNVKPEEKPNQTHNTEISKSFNNFINQMDISKQSNMEKSVDVSQNLKQGIKSKNVIKKLNDKKRINTMEKSIKSSQSNVAKVSVESTGFGETTDVFTELQLMGIIPEPASRDSKELPNKKCSHEMQMFTDSLLLDRSFLQQPDIVQEVTKSQLCNSDMLICDQSTILSVTLCNKDFQNFSDFWKLDNDTKFPVFTTSQRDKLYEWANKFGYDVPVIADSVGKSLSEFVIQQVGGISRLNRLNIPQIPKIAVLLSYCQTSIFVASMARHLLLSGCYVIAYFDDTCFEHNDDMTKEIKLLQNTFQKCHEYYGFNLFTTKFADLEDKTFDFIISGWECDSKSCAPKNDLINWSYRQKAPILCINPPTMSYLPWKLSAFVGVPTAVNKHLTIRTRYECDNGFFKPRLDGVVGLEIDRMLKKSDGLVFLFNTNLPQDVYGLLNLNYKSPFTSKNWIRLYRENDLLVVE